MCNLSERQGLAVIIEKFLFPTKTLLLSKVLNIMGGSPRVYSSNFLMPLRALKFSMLTVSSFLWAELQDFFLEGISFVVLILISFLSLAIYLYHRVCGWRMWDSSKCFSSSKYEISNSFCLACSYYSLTRFVACLLRVRRMLIYQNYSRTIFQLYPYHLLQIKSTPHDCSVVIIHLKNGELERRTVFISIFGSILAFGEGMEKAGIMMAYHQSIKQSYFQSHLHIQLSSDQSQLSAPYLIHSSTEKVLHINPTDYHALLGPF